MYYTLKIDNPDKLFFTSDTHFGHFGICKYCHRPFASRSEMDNSLIENWNKIVPEDGIVIHCGDLMLPHNEGFKEYRKYIQKLNGTIYLLRGNHDMIETGEYNFFGAHNIDDVNQKLIVNDIMMINVDGIKIYAQHCPVSAYPADYHVFGHIHTMSDGTCYGIDGDVTEELRKTQYDVGVDQNGYKPISYWELCDIFRNKAKNS